jgi:hypothetical protein
VDQKIRDTEYATMPMNFRMAKEAMEYQGRAQLNRTEPRLEAELMEAENVVAAETRSTGYHYRHYDKSSRGNGKDDGLPALSACRSISTETPRSGEKATMSPKPRSSHHTRTRHRTTRI